jgi:hypothetical protein
MAHEDAEGQADGGGRGDDSERPKRGGRPQGDEVGLVEESRDGTAQ